MTSLDALLGTISWNGSPLELGSGLNFAGAVTVARNAATGKIDITVTGGGGGSAHTIENNGAALVQRTSLNFIGFTTADVGGKSTVTLPAISLTTGVSGKLPRANQADGTAAGQQPFWDGSSWRLLGLLTGTNLTDANQTLSVAGGAQYLLSAALTASRDKRLALAGATKGLMVTVYSIATRAFSLVVKDDASGVVLFTFPASSTPIVATFRLNDTETAYDLAGWAPLGTVV